MLQKYDKERKIILKIYTDGSFDKKRSMNSTAYASIIVLEETEEMYVVDIIYGVNTDPNYTSMWNVGGEIWGVLVGMDYISRQYNPSTIDIYYDYAGLGKWTTGQWKTNNPTTASYARYMQNLAKSHTITYNQVPGHSNILLNELADHYAKCGTSKYLKTGEVNTIVKEMVVPKI